MMECDDLMSSFSTRRRNSPTARALCRALLCPQDRSLQYIGRMSLHVGGHMRVKVERHGDVGVTQSLLHDLAMHPLSEQKRSAGMAQVVEADYRYVCAGDETAEATIERVGVQVAASIVREHVPAILVDLVHREPVFELSHSMAL